MATRRFPGVSIAERGGDDPAWKSKPSWYLVATQDQCSADGPAWMPNAPGRVRKRAGEPFTVCFQAARTWRPLSKGGREVAGAGRG